MAFFNALYIKGFKCAYELFLGQGFFSFKKVYINMLF